MSDIRRLADRIVSLRDGAVAGVFEDRPLDYEGAVNAMLGQAIAGGAVEARAGGVTLFRAEGLVVADGALPLSLALGDGEIVAVTGLVGAGKTALAETLFGLRRPLAGAMRLGGRPYAPQSPRQAIEAGVFLVAKDRAASGIVGTFNVYENMSLPFLRRLSALSVSRRGAERAVARWMTQPAALFMLDEPSSARCRCGRWRSFWPARTRATASSCRPPSSPRRTSSKRTSRTWRSCRRSCRNSPMPMSPCRPGCPIRTPSEGVRSAGLERLYGVAPRCSPSRRRAIADVTTRCEQKPPASAACSGFSLLSSCTTTMRRGMPRIEPRSAEMTRRL